MELTSASRQWATRGPDERFTTLLALHEAVSARREKSHERNNLQLSSLRVESDERDNLLLRGHNGAAVEFTHHAFGQFATQVAGPRAASYLRRLPADLTVTNLSYHLGANDLYSDDVKLLYTYEPGGKGQARAFSTPTYGRIWDAQITAALLEMNADDRWHVPPAFNKMDGFVVDKSNTTMYASDHDMYAFLVDERHPISLGDQTYFRGFYAWNSEAANGISFGLSTFLYSYVCCNRIIWGARDVQELRMRHTKNAPERFFRVIQPALEALAESDPSPIIAKIKEAQATRIAKDTHSVEKWLAARGFTKYVADKAIALAAAGGSTGSSGDPTSLWDVIQGGTALARNVTHTDTRVRYEREWANLLRYSGKTIKTDDLPEVQVEDEAEADFAYAF